MKMLFYFFVCFCFQLIFAEQMVLAEPTSIKHQEMMGSPLLRFNADLLQKTKVSPFLDENILKGQNLVWCATAQVVWNELLDLNGAPIQIERPSDLVSGFNKKAVNVDVLNDGSYVAMAGKIGEGIIEKIKQALKVKFQDLASPEILDFADSLVESELFAYSYLFENLPFEWAFERPDQRFVFDGINVEFFGIDQYDPAVIYDQQMAEQVMVYDYKEQDDFILELKTRSNESQVILARIPAEKTLALAVNVVQKRMSRSQSKKMEAMANLQIPVFNFDLRKTYNDLGGQKIVSDNSFFDGVTMGSLLQQIRFKLDETGAVFKSEAMYWWGDTQEHYLFNEPFLIMLKKRTAEKPYFAMWIENTELLLPIQEIVTQ